MSAKSRCMIIKLRIGLVEESGYVERELVNLRHAERRIKREKGFCSPLSPVFRCLYPYQAYSNCRIQFLKQILISGSDRQSWRQPYLRMLCRPFRLRAIAIIFRTSIAVAKCVRLGLIILCQKGQLCYCLE